MRRHALLALLVVAGLVVAIELLGPLVRSFTPSGAHAWISNFGGGLLIAILASGAVIYCFDRERQLVTPLRLAVAVIGLLLLLVYRPDVDCRVEMHGRRNPIVCD
jgi:hypothetical protein